MTPLLMSQYVTIECIWDLDIVKSRDFIVTFDHNLWSGWVISKTWFEPYQVKLNQMPDTQYRKLVVGVYTLRFE